MLLDDKSFIRILRNTQRRHASTACSMQNIKNYAATTTFDKP